MNKTPWFPAATPPVREGVYEVQLCLAFDIVKARWTGKRWEIRLGPFSQPSVVSTVVWYEFRWRGLRAL
jgi:hypothetical protein